MVKEHPVPEATMAYVRTVPIEEAEGAVEFAFRVDFDQRRQAQAPAELPDVPAPASNSPSRI